MKAQLPKTVLITGTSSGIGRATALLLDRSGYRVFACVRKEADGEKLRQSASERLQPLILDVTVPEQISQAVSQVRTLVGEAGLNALVNNAGVAEGGPLECMSLERTRRQFEVNVFGPIAVTQAFLPLIHQARGRIVTISSSISDTSIPFLGAYAGSKSAIRAMMSALRRELRWFGIKVSIVLPGFIVGPIWDEVPRSLEKVKREDPEGRYQDLLQGLVNVVEPVFTWGAPPEAVGRVVRRALTSRWPRAVYRVGPGSQMARLCDWIPESLVHGLQARMMRRQHRAQTPVAPLPGATGTTLPAP